MEIIFTKSKEFIKLLLFCFNISWKASKRYLLLRCGIEILMAVIPFGLIVMIKEIVDFFVYLSSKKEDVVDDVYKLVILLSVILLLSIVVRIIGRIKEYCAGIHKDLIGRVIETQIAQKSAELDLSYFDSTKFYNEMMNAKRDSNALQTLTWFVIDIIRALLQFSISLIVLVKLNLLFAAIIIISGIPSIISEKRFTEVIYRWYRNHVPEERKMGYILGLFSGRGFAKDIRLFGIQQELLSRYSEMWEKWFKEKRSITFKRSKWVILLTALPEIGAIGVSLYVGIEIIYGRLTVGDYTLYTSMVGQLMGALFMLINLTTRIYDNNMRLVNYSNFLEWESTIKDKGEIVPELPLKIEFVEVAFKYPNTEEYILKNVNFVMNQNEKIALVGLNGSGKTTIVKLLLRYYDPTEGRILVNGIDMKEYDLKVLRKHFSAMFQDYSDYAFTIKENITISDLDRKDDIEKMEVACDKSDAQTVINKYETGVDTYLTRQFEEDGRELSGGEWQKIALARTFFRDGSIIILDEPSAKLDPEAEHQIFEKFAQLCEGKGAIFISHRLSNVTMADRIIVLENGGIIEEGSHRELIKKKGRYEYLFNLQASKYRVDDFN